MNIACIGNKDMKVRKSLSDDEWKEKRTHLYPGNIVHVEFGLTTHTRENDVVYLNFCGYKCTTS